MDGSPERLRLPRSRRLKSGRDFSRVRAEGGRAVNGCLIANWRVSPEGAASRIGVVVSRKTGGAVARSRARRLLRESFRLHQHEFSAPMDVVLVARSSIAGKKLKSVERDFLSVLRRTGAMAHSA